LNSLDLVGDSEKMRCESVIHMSLMRSKFQARAGEQGGTVWSFVT